MAAISLMLLGGFEARAADGGPLPLPSRKAQALLAYLALNPGRAHGRDKLASLLWEDRDAAAARHSLRQAIADLRRALAHCDPPPLAGEGDTLGLVPGGVEVDALAFERLADTGTPETLEQAVALYRGELLEGVDPRSPAFDEWLSLERARLHERAVAATAALLEQRLAAGGPAERLVPLALHLLALDPLREATHRLLMVLYARQGRRADALKQYRDCRDRLARELGVAPSAETERLHRELLAGRGGPEPVRTAAAEAPEWRHLMALVAAFGADGETDPEAHHARRMRALEAARGAIEREGGRVLGRLGDTLLAGFGLVAAHGDEAERALRTAEALRDGAGADAVPRIGIASGTVLVEGAGEPAGGEPARLAAALALQAAPGEIIVAAAVRASLGPHLQAEPLPGQAAWRVLRRLAEASATAFVGRRAELRQLLAALESCRESGRGQTVLVRGEAGIGKSRLLEECQALAAARGFACHRVRVLDFGDAIGQDAVAAVARSLLGLARDASEAQARAALARLQGSEPLALFVDLLELPPARDERALLEAMETAARPRARRAALARLLLAASRARPLLLVIEDIHWADPSALGMFAALAEAAVDCPTLLTLSSRVEAEPGEPAWRGVLHGLALTTLELGALHQADARALATQLAAGSTEAAIDAWVRRAGGNPLFLEQLAYAARESEAEVPDSVQGLVQMRLDRLAPRDRQAAQAASVLGQRFAPAALRHLLDDSGYGGERLGEQRLLRPEGEDWLFAHALIRDGVYASLLSSRRRALHRKAADWYRERDPGLHAEHLECAGDPGAATAYLEAARAQAAAWRFEPALRAAERGLALATDAATRSALAWLRGEGLRETGDIAAAIGAYREALACAADEAARCRARLGLAAALGVADRHAEALAELAEAEVLARRGGLRAELAQLHYLRGNVLFPSGRLAECLEAHETARRLAVELGSAELEARALSGLGDAWYLRGRMITAHGLFDRCIRLCRKHALRRVEVANLSMRGVTYFYRNFVGEGLADGLHALELARAIQDRRAELVALSVLAAVLPHAGDAEGSVARAREGLALARSLGARRFEAESLCHLAEGLLLLGARAEAERELETAWTLACDSDALGYFGACILGVLARASDDAERRRWALATGEALLGGDCVSHNHLDFRQAAIELALELRDPDAVRHHAAALEAYTREEPLPWSAFCIERGRLLAELVERPGDTAARAALARLARTAERLGLRAALPRMRQTLAP